MTHDMFTPQHLFHIENFFYKQIFPIEKPAWEALRGLKSFFSHQHLGKIEGTLEEGVHLINPHLISIGEGTQVEAGAYIVGPCIIGRNCQIRHAAYLRGFVLAGDEVVIGHATEVKNAIFLDQAKAGHFAYVGDSILGNRVNLGAGTKCANLRFDKKNILINGTDTCLKKMGSILGDDAQTGCNAVLNPGTILFPHSMVRPCKSVCGVIGLKEGVICAL